MKTGNQESEQKTYEDNKIRPHKGEIDQPKKWYIKKMMKNVYKYMVQLKKKQKNVEKRIGNFEE